MNEKQKAWYGPGGALVTGKEIEGITQTLTESGSNYYGAGFLIAESMSYKTAVILSKVLNLEFQGDK